LRRRDYHEVDRQVAAGLAYCGERDLELTRSYLLAVGAHSALDQGRWTDAADAAAEVLRDPPAAPLDRVLALAALGPIRARRGDPDVWRPLDEARALAEPTGELQRIAPVAAARAEAAWLEGAPDAIEDETNAAFELAVRRGSPPLIGQLACWRRRAGIPVEIPPDESDPHVCSARGDWRRAAEQWAELGCPYDAALALADGDEEGALRRSLDALQGLGAKPAAAIVARRLRERGARDLPRGPRAATRRNPAGLTRRELEVLALVAEGLRNGDIAARLVVSERTIDHHVGAILRKLAVKTRGEASVKAVRLGLVS
jgi:DNA-binding CsgD family transcriptional regulator